ncbi:MAG: TIGR00725 family protein [Thaumarchaeota archaeon]|nr:TIGR00725 family protein [Nitrososphaerota archaeon]
MDRKPQILVIGYNENACTPQLYELAYRAGKRVAEKDAILITGGLGGVMEAASKGCSDAGGICVGIIPFDDRSKANQYNSIVICTGIGYARNFATAYSADAIVVLGGGAGTLSEMAAAYLKATVMIAVERSGGVAQQYAGKPLDERNLAIVQAAKDPEEAVDRAIATALSRD